MSGYDAVGGRYFMDADGSRTSYTPAAPVFAAGTQFAYWDDAQNEFGYVLTRALNNNNCGSETLSSVFVSSIANPIGMSSSFRWGFHSQSAQRPYNNCWVNNSSGNEVPWDNSVGADSIQINAFNLARLGLLFMNGGRWGTRQLISSAWVSEATRVQVPEGTPVNARSQSAPNGGPGEYGFNWWVNGGQLPDAPSDAYWAAGKNNNIMLVIPSRSVIVVRLSAHDVGSKSGEMNNFIRALLSAM
jgi:hypothetical protein